MGPARAHRVRRDLRLTPARSRRVENGLIWAAVAGGVRALTTRAGAESAMSRDSPAERQPSVAVVIPAYNERESRSRLRTYFEVLSRLLLEAGVTLAASGT